MTAQPMNDGMEIKQGFRCPCGHLSIHHDRLDRDCNHRFSLSCNCPNNAEWAAANGSETTYPSWPCVQKLPA
jgi:hypothetical protein